MNSTVESKDQNEATQEMKKQVATEIQELVRQLDLKKMEAIRMGLNICISAINLGHREAIGCRVWEDMEYVGGWGPLDTYNSNPLIISYANEHAPEDDLQTTIEKPVGSPNDYHGRVNFHHEQQRRAYKLF